MSIQGTRCSANALIQPKRGNNALKIVIPVIFDLDPAAFFAVMNGDACAEMLLQTLLQIFDRGRGHGNFTSAALAPFSCCAQLPSHEPFRCADRGAAAQDGLRYEQLFLGNFQTEQYLGVSDRQQILRKPNLNLRMQVEQAHGVGDGRAAAADF